MDEEYKYAVVHKMIHRFPGKEECNLDAARQAGNRSLRTASFRWRIPWIIRGPLGYTLCAYCFPEGLTDDNAREG